MLDSIIVSKRLIENQKFSKQPLMKLLRPGLVLSSSAKADYINNMIINHCLYQRESEFKNIIETYLTTKRFSDFQNSFCEEIEKIEDSVKMFKSRFAKAETSILKINPRERHFRTLISFIIHSFNPVFINEIDQPYSNENEFLESMRKDYLENIRKDYDNYQNRKVEIKPFRRDLIRRNKLIQKIKNGNAKFIEFLEIADDNSMFFDNFMFDSHYRLLNFIKAYLNEDRTLPEFQEDLDTCWMNALLNLERVTEIPKEELQKNSTTYKIRLGKRPIGFIEFLYQITNTLYFVDLELVLENGYNYKITQDEFKNYLKNLLVKMEKFVF